MESKQLHNRLFHTEPFIPSPFHISDPAVSPDEFVLGLSSRSACCKISLLFKKPHVNLGTQQYTLHFKNPLWVDFYFHSFKMELKKPWNSQYWPEWEGWGTGALWWQRRWSPCESPSVCDFTPLQVWHKLSDAAALLPNFPTASFLGAIATVSRNSSSVILKLLQEESISSIYPFKSKPQVLAAHPVGLLGFFPVATSSHYISVPVVIKTGQ